MDSVVIELQKDLLDNQSDIVSILRKAHLIARKLGLSDFDKWINHELNGYTPSDIIPEYRILMGRLMAMNPYRGWIPVILTNDEINDNLCKRSITNSISELIELANLADGNLIMRLSPEVQKILNNSIDIQSFYEYAVIISKTAVKDIEQKVKNSLLEWCIKLEENGILGKNFVFTNEEKEIATEKNKTGIINVNVVTGSNSTVIIPSTVGDNSEIKISQAEFSDLTKQIREKIQEEIQDENNRNQAIEILTRIERNTKKSVLKTLFGDLRSFLISIGAGVTAAFIDAKIKGII